MPELALTTPSPGGRTPERRLSTLSRKALGLVTELLPQSKAFLAIEFDRHLLKFIRVDDPKHRTHVSFLKVKTLASDEEEEVERVLADTLREMGVKGMHPVTISIPRHAVHTKILHLPSHDPVELRKMAFYRMHQDVPIPSEELVHDLRIISTEEDGTSRVLVVLARRSVLNRYLDICRRNGLLVDAIRLNVEAIYQSFLEFFRDFPQVNHTCMALVDVDFSATNVLIIEQRKLLFCRSIPAGMEELMERMVGARPQEVYEEWIDGLSRGIADTINAVRNIGLDVNIKHVALTGWLPRVQKLTHRLENNLSMPVSWFDLMIPLEQFGGTGDVGEFHHWFSISTLLGMTRARDDTLMDLRPEEERKRQRQRAFKRRLTGTALILLYIFALSVAAVKFSLHQRHGLLAQLQTEVAALRPKVQALKHLEEAEKRLRQQLGSTKRTSALLAELLQKLPPSVQLNSLSLYRGEKLLATGVSDRLDDVLSLPQLLDAQPDFDAVELTSVDRRQRNGRQEIYFEIKVNFSTNED